MENIIKEIKDKSEEENFYSKLEETKEQQEDSKLEQREESKEKPEMKRNSFLSKQKNKIVQDNAINIYKLKQTFKNSSNFQ